MAQYIFTLNAAAQAGDSTLKLNLLSVDKITNLSSYPANLIRENYYVTTFVSQLAIPDFTTVTSLNVQDGVLNVELSDRLLSPISINEDVVFRDFVNKVRQSKIGFDRIAVPKIFQNQQLVDIVTGDTLTDAYGNPLVTRALVNVKELANKKTATSLVVGDDIPLAIKEVFPDFSEVSRSLLGISKAERQIGLFADVSVLGLDKDTWEYKVTQRTSEYSAWGTRGTANQGDHYSANIFEKPDEQALVLGAFPTSYSYPWQYPNYRYDTDKFDKFKTFIELGNALFTYFKSQPGYGDSFYNNFLDPDKVTIGPITGQYPDGTPNPNNTLLDQIVYNEISEEEGLLLIDIWTTTFTSINEGSFINPTTGLPFTRSTLTGFVGLTPQDPFNNGKPGYDILASEEVVLESKRTFRYQPGRMSGFTFGVRASSDSGSENNIIEWGTYNPSDQYLFQVKGANINIVRRSTIPLPDEIISAYGLRQTLTTYTDPVTNRLRDLYELVIPRSSWNIDSLDGNGPSKYLLDPKHVTMYKIEFSWYGAIGVNFYAYIPVANNEARWVRLNRIVIENKMKTVCLEDPFFKFKYSLKITDPSKLKTPQYIYKYGASYYIDGTDDGAKTFNTVTSNIKSINRTKDSILLGLYPKPTIENSEGAKKKNKRLILPENMVVTATDELCKVSIISCKACPGFGYTYDLGLTAKDTLSKSVEFYFRDMGDNVGKVKFCTKYSYPVTYIDYSTESVTITAQELPTRIKDGDIFKFKDYSTEQLYSDLTSNVYAVTDIVYNDNSSISLTISSSTGVFPEYTTPPAASDVNMQMFSQLFTANDHNSKIIVGGMYGFYLDMKSTIADYEKSEPTVELALSDGTQNYFDTSYMLKIKGSRTREKLINFNKKSAYEWPESWSTNPLLSGGLVRFKNGLNITKLIDLSYYILPEAGSPIYYPMQAILANPNTCMAASDHPIEGPITTIQFLNPKKTYDPKHVGDFSIGITPRKPVYVDGKLKFKYGEIYKDLDDKDLLYTEHIADRINMTSNFDNNEIIDLGRERFDIDRNISNISSYDNAGGACSKINVTIPEVLIVTSCNILSGINISYPQKPSNIKNNKCYLITDNSAISGQPIVFTGGEAGINNASSGIVFSSELSSWRSTNPLNQSITRYFYIEMDTTIEQPDIELDLTYVELNYPTGNAELKYESTRKIFNYNPFPLYVVVKMTDRTKINSINFKEELAKLQQTIAPHWLHNDGITIDNVKNKAISNDNINNSLPENFVSRNRLDATSYDITSNRILRSEIQQIKASYYVGMSGGQQTQKINLNSIYGSDKSIITQDLLGVEAVFLTAHNINNNNTNNVQLTLNVSEQ